MKKALLYFSVLAILICGIYAVRYNYENNTVTYDGSGVNVTELYEQPDMYKAELEEGKADSVADVIVKENLSDTMAANNVAAVVFDFRGFDTLGESFILLTAIAGAFVILAAASADDEKGGDGQ